MLLSKNKDKGCGYDEIYLDCVIVITGNNNGSKTRFVVENRTFLGYEEWRTFRVVYRFDACYGNILYYRLYHIFHCSFYLKSFNQSL